MWLSTALGAMCTLALARWLRPDARGFGTHEQLGLAPCAFRAITGVPCPGCGLTTSFACMSRLRVLDAFRAHAMGPPLFVIVCALALYAPFAFRFARPITAPLRSRPVGIAVIATALAGLAVITYRVAVGAPAP